MEIMPELICQVNDEDLGIIGYLVIDSTINNKSWGGVRILPEVSPEELIHSARIMSLKYAFLGYPIGGAKSGIILSPSLSEKRNEILKIFGKRLAPFLKSKLYMLGIDMGTSVEDLKEIANAAGVKMYLKKWKDVSHIYTSWSMLTSTKVALKKIGKRLSDCTVAIEGFGKVGSASAKVFSDSGARVVAISNLRGAIYSEKGLDVNELIRLRGLAGDEVVDLYGDAERIKQEELLELNVDILLLCARLWSIDLSNVASIKARLICPGANLPIRDGMDNLLYERGIMFLPSFVANSGGVFGSIMREVVSDKNIYRMIDIEIGRKVEELLNESEKNKIPVGKFARDVLEKKFNMMKGLREKENKKSKPIKKIMYYAALKLPKFIIEPVAIRYYTAMAQKDFK